MKGPLAPLLVQDAASPADTLSAAENVQELLVTEGLGPLLRVAVIVLIGFPLLLAVSRWLRRWITATGSQQRGMVAGKLFFYTG